MPNRKYQWAHGNGVNFEGGSSAIGPKSPAGAASLATKWVGFDAQCDCRLMGFPAISLFHS